MIRLERMDRNSDRDILKLHAAKEVHIMEAYGLVLTSTQEDEEAQHFYRAMGYRDCGNLEMPFPGYEQPAGLIMGKSLQA